MSCVCTTCQRHATTLGLARWPASREATHHAYRSAAKLWHPDRFANDQARIHEAEERFKSLQAAYRELTEHNHDDSEDESSDSVDTHSTNHAGEAARQYTRPVVEPFATVPGCVAVSQFSPVAHAVVARHLGSFAYPVAIADLSGEGSFDRFFLLASHGVIVKDAVGSVSLLLYEDLGRMQIVDRENAGTLSFWEKIAAEFTGISPKWSLEIYRHSGAEFCILAGELNDAAKLPIHQYLSRKKQQYKR